MGLVWTSCLSKFGLEFLFTLAWFEPIGLLFQELCCKLVWCTPVLETGFVYTYTINWFCVHVYFKLVWVQDRDRQGYHTDRTLHIIGNVHGQTLQDNT